MRLSLILLLLTGMGFLCGCATTDRRQAAEIFGNMTYYIGNEHFAQPAKLVNCGYFSPFLKLHYDNKFVYGDFNHDGLKDAAVITIENTGGNADWYMLDFLINDGKQFVHRATRALDDRAIINAFWQKNDKVFIYMYIHQEGDCMGGPSKRVKNVYEYTGPDSFGLGKDSWKDDSHFYKPQEGFVSNETTAIKIGEAVLTAVYGEKIINSQKPFTADLGNDIWTVLGKADCPDYRRPCNQLSIGIRQDNGEILSVSRIK